LPSPFETPGQTSTMDAVSTAWSIFSTCYQVYQVVDEAIELNTESKVWNVQMRVERVRFEVWGRTLGFLDEKTGCPKSLDKADLAIDNGGLSSIVELETANKLICDLLQATASALDEFREAAEKYSLEAKGDESPSPATPTGRRGKAAAGLNKAWLNTKLFTKHVAYVVMDKGLVEKLIQKLGGLNDSLEKLLTLSEKVQYAKAVSSGVLVRYRHPGELDAVINALADGEQKPNQSGILMASARVKQLCIGIDSSQKKSWDVDQTMDPPAGAEPGSSKVALNLVRGFQAPIKTEQDHHWPISLATYTTGAETAQRVMIEWRSAAPSAARFAIEQSELVRRRDAIVQLLHKTSTMAGAGDYRLLDCLGYIEGTGRDGSRGTNVVGFLSLFPDWADEQGEPVTLRTVLQESFDNVKSGTRPSLPTRFHLARRLANALYQLQCSNWLHRNLSSHQVVFFRDKESGAVRLDEPYLIGFQYSRPDDNHKHGSGGIVASEGFRINNNFPELYLPAEFYLSEERRYRRSDDVYSMGVLLFEIALWEPVQILHVQGDDVQKTASKLLEIASSELPSEVGELYSGAVLRCLRGLREGEVAAVKPFERAGEAQRYDGRYRGEDPEYGLEVDFLWKVLREIEKCRV